MAENITLGTVSTFANDTTAVATVNSNSSIIETAFEDCLSLSGGQPNSMQSNLDMNNFQVINLPAPSTLSSPVRLQDVVTNGSTITVNTLPAGGSTNALLHKGSGVDYDATWTLTPSGLTSLSATTLTGTTVNGTTHNVTGTEVFSGSSSGTTTVQASATASGTLTLPAATDTLTGKATTDTLTNKTLDTAGTGNVLKFGGVAVSSSAATGTGVGVLATSPTLVTPNIGVATGTSLTASGLIKSTSKTAGIGYATGAGSTDSQATSKSTTVTSVSNPMCGTITMNNAALVGATTVSFTFNNTSIGANDVVIVNIATGTTGASATQYLCSVVGVRAGACDICIYNNAGSKSDALVLNYAIIKAVNA